MLGRYAPRDDFLDFIHRLVKRDGALPNEVAEYTEFDLQRLAVKPGITGWWQVTDRNSTGFDGMVQRDLEYIARRGVITDLKIVLLTVVEVITGSGAC